MMDDTVPFPAFVTTNLVLHFPSNAQNLTLVASQSVNLDSSLGPCLAGQPFQIFAGEESTLDWNSLGLVPPFKLQ